jgi:hypothetical protein
VELVDPIRPLGAVVLRTARIVERDDRAKVHGVARRGGRRGCGASPIVVTIRAS